MSADSDDVDAHTKTNCLRLHHSATDANGQFSKPDELTDTTDEPDHQGLCDLEQAFFLNTIQNDVDMTDHLNEAVRSLQIVLAADESFKTGKTVYL